MGLKKRRDAVVLAAEALVGKYRPDTPEMTALASAVEALPHRVPAAATSHEEASYVDVDKLRGIATQVQALLTAAAHLRKGQALGTPGLNVGNAGTINLEGQVLVPFGLTGCGTVFHCALSKREARQLALKLLQATTE